MKEFLISIETQQKVGRTLVAIVICYLQICGASLCITDKGRKDKKSIDFTSFPENKIDGFPRNRVIPFPL